MSDRPRPGEYKAAELLRAVEHLLADARATSWSRAYGRALEADVAISSHNLRAVEADPKARMETAYGNFAGLVLMWITSGRADSQALEAAHQVLYGPEDDPLRKKVYDLARRFETGDITWSGFVKMGKKGLIPRARPEHPPPKADAIPLEAAKATLAEMLVTAAGSSADPPDPRTAWDVFKLFSAQAVAATLPAYIEHDACLFQWGVYDWGKGSHFEWDLVRQFVLNDSDGDYDHMEQLHLTLLFDAQAELLACLPAGNVWSGPSLDDWIREVESLDAFTLAKTHSAQPVAMRLDHHDV
jgi:hypothetical protein